VPPLRSRLLKHQFQSQQFQAATQFKSKFLTPTTAK